MADYGAVFRAVRDAQGPAYGFLATTGFRRTVGQARAAGHEVAGPDIWGGYVVDGHPVRVRADGEEVYFEEGHVVVVAKGPDGRVYVLDGQAGGPGELPVAPSRAWFVPATDNLVVSGTGAGGPDLTVHFDGLYAGKAADFRAAQHRSMNGVSPARVVGDFPAPPAGGASRVGFVGVVPVKFTGPATADHLFEIATAYRDGLSAGQRARFVLVLGVNGEMNTVHAVGEGRMAAAIKGFEDKWQRSGGGFPVVVSGWTWNHLRGGPVNDQKSVPMGMVRETLVRDALTAQQVQRLREAGVEQVYLHMGDADAQTLTVATGAHAGQHLFDVAAQRLQAAGGDHGWPEVASGGYVTSRGEVFVDADAPPVGAVAVASRLDLAVRAAMAEVDPRSVYYPEPNLFLRVPEQFSSSETLESGVTMGTADRESERLLEKLSGERHFGVEHAKDPVMFDPSMVIATSGARIGARVSNDDAGLLKLTQSHADPDTWGKQLQHYAETFLKDHGANGFPLTDAHVTLLKKLVFDQIPPGDADTAARPVLQPDMSNVWRRIAASPDHNRADAKALAELPQVIRDIAKATRAALATELNAYHGHGTPRFGTGSAAPTPKPTHSPTPDHTTPPDHTTATTPRTPTDTNPTHPEAGLSTAHREQQFGTPQAEGQADGARLMPGPERRVQVVQPTGEIPQPRSVDVPSESLQQGFGMPEAHRAHFQRLADEFGVVIDVRPTNPEAPRWLAEGAVPKPQEIKAKTINEVDIWLGANPDHKGLVALFEPALPDRSAHPEMSEKLWSSISARYELRSREYRNLPADLRSLPDGLRPTRTAV